MTTQLIEVKIQDSPKSWTDHAKLGADLAGPVIAAIFGIWVLRLTKRIEQNQWKNQKLIEKRILIWDQVGPIVNDIYCYCKRIGPWKKMTPADIIERKRAADKIIHVNRSYFSVEFFNSYMDFTEESFAMYQNHGDDAKIKTFIWEHKNASAHWDGHWDLLIEDKLDENKLDHSYEIMIAQLREDLISS
jgi:hypothetical protein